MADDIVGLDAKLFHSATALDGSTNTPGSVTWAEVVNCRDLTAGLTSGLGDLSHRGARIRQQKTTIQDWELTFAIVWQGTDTIMQAIRDAFINGTAVALWAADGPDAVGSQGPAANWSITNFTRNEPLEDGVTVDVTAVVYTQGEWFEKTGP